MSPGTIFGAQRPIASVAALVPTCRSISFVMRPVVCSRSSASMSLP